LRRIPERSPRGGTGRPGSSPFAGREPRPGAPGHTLTIMPRTQFLRLPEAWPGTQWLQYGKKGATMKHVAAARPPGPPFRRPVGPG
jgi:hypothetical protein